MTKPKKISGVKLWSVVTVVMAALLIASIIGSNIALEAAPAINAFLKTDTFKVAEKSGKNEDTAYYKSGYATPEERAEAVQHIAEQVAGEGAVLLRNNGALPLKTDDTHALKEALENAGFGVKSGVAVWDDAAIVTIVSEGTALTEAEKAMLENAREDFGTVIVLINADDMDFGFLEEYDVDAALQTGSSGTWGLNAAADLLAGNVNPSGRLTDSRNFGYGLSYTTFEWGDFRCFYNEGSDLFGISVTVTNTGEMAGKEVVQVYVRRPGEGTAELCGFAKTALLEPGAFEIVTITVRGEALAADGILDAGDYSLTVAPDARSAAGGTAFTDLYNVAQTDAGKYAVSNEMVSEDGCMPVMGAENGLELAMFIGRDFDDPAWEKLLDQLTAEDMALLIAGNDAAIPSVGKPETRTRQIGPDFPDTDTLIAAFNTELAAEMGVLVGEDCLARGVSALYIPNTETGPGASFLTEAILAAERRGIQSRGVYFAEDGSGDTDSDLRLMRSACHGILYTVANSSAMNGISASAAIVSVIPWWQLTLYGLMALFGLGTVACGTRLVFVLGTEPKKK